MKQFKKLSEGEAGQLIGYRPAAQVIFTFQNIEYGGGGKNDLKVRKTVIDVFQLAGPGWVFMDLIDKQVGTSHADKGTGQIKQSLIVEPVMIRGDIESLRPVRYPEFEILQEHGRLSQVELHAFGLQFSHESG